MHRFFFERNRLIDDAVTLSEEESRHAARVLRLKPGAEIVLLDGFCHVYSARVASVDAPCVTAHITGTLPDNEPGMKITLYQGLPKADKMDWLAQKNTELGVHAIQPVLFSRCDRSIGKNSEGSVRRCRRIVREAAKQCGRGLVPTVAFPLPFEEALPMIGSHARAFAAWEGEAQQRIADFYRVGETDIAVVIGPEGGITPEEARRLASSGAHLVTLGKRILRAETAGIAALASILTLSGEL
jgi:16S rRNA (uracil1498-N3)-methyltransferase